jgi:hypothetical protein
MQLIDRTIDFGAQVAGIGVGGLLETFGLSDSALGDPNKSWLGRVFAGFAGARPASGNMAGETQTPVKPKDDAKQGARDAMQQTGPMLNIESFVQAPNRNGEQTAKDLAFRTYSSAGRR